MSRHLLPPGALVTILVAATNPLGAHAAQPAPPFEIPSSILQPTVALCQELQETTTAGSSSAPSADKALETGICLYHVLRDGTDRQGLLNTISVLESAQTWGLDRSRQAAANLMEGLSSCRVAQLELNPTPGLQGAQSPLFCLARKSAHVSFSRLRVQDLRVTYEAGTSETLDTLMSAMTACYAEEDGPLNKRFAAGCGVYEGLDASGVAAVASKAYGDIRQRYLLGAAAPITAMFTRKKEMAQAGLEDTQASVEALKLDSARIWTAYEAESRLYTQIDAPLGDLIKGYQATFATASAVLKQYDAWKQGLFEQKTPVVISYTGQLQTRIAEVGSLVSTISGSTDTVGKAVTALQNRVTQDAAMKKNARAMCRAFFCELAVNQGRGLGSKSSFTNVCNRMLSPLCPSQGTKLNAGGAQFTPVEFCAEAEFPAKYMVYGMSRVTANTCWLEAT